jgi:hypothetical protein
MVARCEPWGKARKTTSRHRADDSAPRHGQALASNSSDQSCLEVSTGAGISHGDALESGRFCEFPDEVRPLEVRDRKEPFLRGVMPSQCTGPQCSRPFLRLCPSKLLWVETECTAKIRELTPPSSASIQHQRQGGSFDSGVRPEPRPMRHRSVLPDKWPNRWWLPPSVREW